MALISENRFLPAKVQFKTRAINLTYKIRSGFKRMRCIMSMNSEKRTLDIITCTCMSIKKRHKKYENNRMMYTLSQWSYKLGETHNCI